MTSKISFFSLRRASCLSQGETLREQVGEPAQRTGFFASLRLKNLFFNHRGTENTELRG
ncbi:hypothetical protein N0Y54_23290 [Nostoc punctiforme UO1]|uniref:hypothetical protein n=1 Tax=Nostoc punctiforme TaxID=272131 RepID=UPI0030B3D193